MKFIALREWVLLVFAILWVTGASAQEFGKGQTLISAGIGLGNFNIDKVLMEEGKWQTVAPLYLKVEHGVKNRLALGLSFSYYRVDGRPPIYKVEPYVDPTGAYIVPPIIGFGKYQNIVTGYSVQARLNWHPYKMQLFDPYFGVGLGYKGGNWKRAYYQWSEVGPIFPVGMSFSFGTRVYATRHIGAYAEIGIEKALLQFGLTYRIGK
jgi:hypothetical protein